MKKLIYITALSFIICSCSGQSKKEENKLVDSKKDEWISLFDGKTTKGWHYYNGGKIGDGNIMIWFEKFKVQIY